MKLILEAFLNATGTLNGAGEEKLQAEIEHKGKAKQFHRRLNDWPNKKRGQAGKGNGAINDFHHGGSQPNQ